MRIGCDDRWSSVDPLVEMYMDLVGHRIPWQVRVLPLPRTALHEVFRVRVDRGEIVPRDEDFRIYLVTEILVEASPALLESSADPVHVSVSRKLSRILVGDKVIVNHDPRGDILMDGCGQIICGVVVDPAPAPTMVR